MSVEFPTLAEVMSKHQIQTLWYGQHDGWWECTCQGGEFAIAWTPDHVDVEWREACTIRTAEQLDALKADPSGDQGAVLKDANGDIQESNDDGTWCEMGSRRRVWPILPALLIWHPDWSAS